MNFEGWNKYVSCLEDNFESCTFKDELLGKCGGNRDIAITIYYHSQDNSLKWMDSPIPALENKIPSKEISAGRADTVRQVIWRIPC
ncbi:antitoxin Xre/MbcA/ParS toxin-binding domain-containing protein [Vibrio sp. LaRot3]|uniref:antitoxin Xre/MbcA/ParS toxin-binding domain-containing protein n=1 Tax=Vibrio sp. LaRot3 TaxID=2998829 RepID=UPI0022CE3394|nr:antitoxin Xre/MbcA/ParS toxin-binding domain-containing protein [Vibrio sp. LaRot3]MDA0149540.1 DUF2384 domain-containing protein [Vibrio sp. LaRot3]